MLTKDGVNVVKVMRSIEFGLTRLEEIESLPLDWYDNTERVVPKQHIELLREVLPHLKFLPFIVPTGNNSLQLEYDMGNKYFEVELFEDSITIYIEVCSEEIFYLKQLGIPSAESLAVLMNGYLEEYNISE